MCCIYTHQCRKCICTIMTFWLKHCKVNFCFCVQFCMPGCPWGSLGPLGLIFGASWAPPGHLQAPLGRLWGLTCSLLGAIWDQLDASWGSSGFLLGQLGLQVASKWPPSGHHMASKWLPGALQVLSKWTPVELQLAHGLDV